MATPFPRALGWAIGAAGAALTLALPSLAAQSDTVWQYIAPAKVLYTRVDPAGHLLVGTDSVVIALEPDSGKVVWTYPVGGRVRLLGASPLGHLLVGYEGVIAALDAVTGDTIWHRADLPSLEQASFAMGREDRTGLLQTKNGFASIDLGTGLTRWDSTALPPHVVVREYFRAADHNLLILLARTPASDAALLAVTFDSGRVAWRDDSFFVTKPKFERTRSVESLTDFQAPVVLPDTTAIFYFSADGPVRVDPRSGRVVWRATELAGRAVGGVDKGYPAMRLRDSLLLVPSGKQLVALDTATGRVRWTTAVDFRDRPSWLVSRSSPVLVGGIAREKPFLAAFDPATGAPMWPAEISLKATASAYLLRDTVYVSNDGWLAAIPLATGVVRDLTEIGFQGGEQPIRIDTVEGGGLVLRARQNIMRVTLAGQVVYRRYYKAPGASFLAKLASTALLVGLNVASISLTPPGGLAPIVTGNPVLTARYARASEAENYFYMFTESPDTLGQRGFSLVMVDRRDGRELGRMWFDERSPDYGLDHATGTVYVREGDLQIVARRFRR